jgi:hypothetical protein
MKRYDIDDYQEYVKIQQKRALSKWSAKTFLGQASHFRKLMNDIYVIIGKMKDICCMGIRNGNEYFAFQKLDNFNGSNIYGVDICGEVTAVGKNCYVYDFNKLPKDWSDKFNMVYSNSLDHAFNVEETLNEWHRVVKNNGYIVLTLSRAKNTKSDLYSFEKDDVNTMFDKDKFKIIKVWDKEYFDVLLQVIK